VTQRLLTTVAALALIVSSVHDATAGPKGKGKSTPPSQTVLPNRAAIAPTGPGGVPLAWVDDASVLTPGGVSVSLSTLFWHGADLDETDFPVTDVAVGISPRVQLGASVPRIVDNSEAGGSIGGVGTTYISTKVLLLNTSDSAVKLAVAPTVAILGEGVLGSLTPGDSRAEWGLPVSAEIDRGAARLFGSGGYFSRGVVFAGVGVGASVAPRVAVSASFSRAWTTNGDPAFARTRHELSGGASFSVTPQLSVFGSLGQTLATADDSGAGTTIVGGVSFFFQPAIN
jgi:hypothetical protein